MLTTDRHIVEHYVTARTADRRHTWDDAYGTTQALVDVLLIHAPLHSWTSGRPDAQLLTAADVDDIIDHALAPTLIWTRNDVVDVVELHIDARPVDARHVECTVDAIATNAHAAAVDDLLTTSGLDPDAVMTLSIGRDPDRTHRA